MGDEQKPTLSQYFSDDNAPAASQLFDTIAAPTIASDMLRSVHLENADNISVSYSQVRPEPPRVQSPTNLVEASGLPDPSTFFDTMAPSSVQNLNQSMEGMHLKDTQSDPLADRRQDAWIPSQGTKLVLQKAQSAPPGSFFPEKDSLTMPGLILTKELTDSLKDAAFKYLGVGEATSRTVLRREHVTQDEKGLRELMRAGYLRAALNLTTTLLMQAGVRSNQPCRHSNRCLQLWLTRFAILSRLELYEVLKMELEPFSDFDKPDMYYQFYPSEYTSRSGSLVPFSLRLLSAESHANWNITEMSLDKLYLMLDTIRQMLSNVRNGKSEDGSGVIQDETDKQESLKLWKARETRVIHSIVNCALLLKDYRLATKLLLSLTTVENIQSHTKRGLYSSIGRIFIQAGHLTAASKYLEIAQDVRSKEICPMADVRELVDNALLEMARGNYTEAYNLLANASQHEPNNMMVLNNLSIVLLYQGRLKDAIQVLDRAVKSDISPSPSLILNLCTLKELQSSNTQNEKLDLLRIMSGKCSDSIPNVCAALKLT